MREEYDFSDGERGRFHRPGAEMRFPIYLDAEVQAALSALASAKGMDVTVLANALLKKDLELIDSTGLLESGHPAC